MTYPELQKKLSDNHFTSASIVEVGKKTKTTAIEVQAKPFMIDEQVQVIEKILEGVDASVKKGAQNKTILVTLKNT